jgi:hypothetical protein
MRILIGSMQALAIHLLLQLRLQLWRQRWVYLAAGPGAWQASG